MVDYKRCRACLVSANDVALKSLYENDGNKAIFLEKFTGISLMNEIQEALICDICSEKLDNVRAFINKARHLDYTYFAAARFLGDWPQACRCCQSALHLRRIDKHGPELVQLLLMITGIDVQDDHDKVFICSKCRKTLKNADLMDFVVNENQKLHFNNKTVSKYAAIINPPEIKTKAPADKIKCSECSKSYSNASNLKLHFLNIHERKTRYDCNFCHFQTLFLTDFLRHVATHLDIAEGKTKQDKMKLPKLKEEIDVSLTCQVCLEDFESISTLKQHFMEKHQASRKFECDYCGWRSVFKKDVANHITCKHVIKSIHDMYDRERRFQCTFKNCKKRFKIQTLMRQHMTRTHSGIRYTCWWCQKSYCSSYKLKKHRIKCLQPLPAIKTEPL